MSTPSVMRSDFYVDGNLQSKTQTYPAGSITNAAVAAAADIDYTKLEHEHRLTYAQANSAAADATQVIYACRGATGSILNFEVGSIAAAVGDSTCTVDLQKSTGGGAFATVLSAVVTLDSGSTAITPEAATVNSASLVDGDVLRVVVDATIGTGTLPTGVYASLSVSEAAA